jgi:cell division control protein 6
MYENYEDPIFRFKEVLSPDYLPDHLPHREREIRAISETISLALRGRVSNVFVHGPPGTGKTASIRFIFKRLYDEGTNALPVYLNCFQCNTRMGALHAIVVEFFRRVRPTRRMPSRRGIAYDELFDLFTSEIKKTKVVPVVCFDEVDHILPRGSEILYDLSRLREESLPAQIVAISNDEYVFRGLDQRARSSMHPMEEVSFQPYSYEEMREIIKARVDAAFQPGVVSEGVISLLAELTSERGGDVRIARETLLQAGELARKQGDERLREEHIRAAISGSKFAKIQALISQLTEHERFILRLIPEKGISYPEFSRFYRENYPRAVGDRMLRNYMEKLSRLKLISLERKGMGGSYFINLNVPRKLLFEIG